MSNVSKNNATNNTEVRVMGLQRTGNHAIINWIGSSFPGENVYLLNHNKVKENPFECACDQEGHETIIFNNYKINREEEVEGSFTKKDCLIYSYEDCRFKDIFDEDFIRKLPSLIGESKFKCTLLILRDPFNLFASRLKREVDGRSNRISVFDNKEDLVNLWKEYAKEFLGKTNYIKGNKIVVNYNLWFTSKVYREALCDSLNIPFSDKGFRNISTIGGGSSFDGHTVTGKDILKIFKRLLAPDFYKNLFCYTTKIKFISQFWLSNKNINVLERWELFKEDELYKSLFKDEELIELSNEIFGKIPGTEVLFESQANTK